MKTIEEVRRIRLKMLINEVGGKAVDLNRRTGKTDRDSTYSQILNRSSGSRSQAPKTMGSSMARQLEIDLKKPRGWMDTDPDLSDDAWPFPGITKSTILTLDHDHLIRLEAVLKMSAKQIGIEIE